MIGDVQQAGNCGLLSAEQGAKSKELRATTAPLRRRSVAREPLRGSCRSALPLRPTTERDRMRAEPNLHQQLCNALVQAGYPSDAVPNVHFRFESQETVDRDYGGSWQEEGEMS
jgi:hypothetical protein